MEVGEGFLHGFLEREGVGWIFFVDAKSYFKVPDVYLLRGRIFHYPDWYFLLLLSSE